MIIFSILVLISVFDINVTFIVFVMILSKSRFCHYWYETITSTNPSQPSSLSLCFRLIVIFVLMIFYSSIPKNSRRIFSHDLSQVFFPAPTTSHIFFLDLDKVSGFGFSFGFGIGIVFDGCSYFGFFFLVRWSLI